MESSLSLRSSLNQKLGLTARFSGLYICVPFGKFLYLYLVLSFVLSLCILSSESIYVSLLWFPPPCSFMSAHLRICLSSLQLTLSIADWRLLYIHSKGEHSYFRIFGHPWSGDKNTATSPGDAKRHDNKNIFKSRLYFLSDHLKVELVVPTRICLGPYMDTLIYT